MQGSLGTVGTGRAPAAGAKGADIFHPWVDFLCLGGASLIIFPILALLPESAYGTLLVVTVLLANLINHPHFAHSYQIFYRNYRQKAFGQETDPVLRLRYLFAGIVVPVGLVAFFWVGMTRSDAQVIGYGANLMAFLVGWHYVKQGYGMLIVDSVMKRQFFDARAKKIFLVNAYFCWFLFWALANYLVVESNLWGIGYYAFNIPIEVVYALGAIAAGSTVLVLKTFHDCWKAKGTLPITGVVAYLVSLYAWLFLRLDPMMLLVIPAFHSLQYLLIVWRYELNRCKAEAERTAETRKQTRRLSIGLSVFLILGVALGYLGFWGVPNFLQDHANYDRAIFGGSAFFFMFWIFINVHHYCLDNVMWRRENPDTRKYLFGHT